LHTAVFRVGGKVLVIFFEAELETH